MNKESKQTAAVQRGLRLEESVHRGLRCLLPKAELLTESQIRKRWGASFNGVDHLLWFDGHLFLMQDKWLSKPVDQIAMAQFIVGCQRIEHRFEHEVKHRHRLLVSNCGLTPHARASGESAGVQALTCDTAIEDLALVTVLWISRVLHLSMDIRRVQQSIYVRPAWQSLWRYGRDIGLPCFDRFDDVTHMANVLHITVDQVTAMMDHVSLPIPTGVVRIPLRAMLARHFLDQIGWTHTGQSEDLIHWDVLRQVLSFTDGSDSELWAIMRSLPAVKEPKELNGMYISLEGLKS
jgi:hypothetical protein